MGIDASGPRLIFDGDCAFCTSSSGWLADRLARRDGTDVRLVPWQYTDLDALGVSEQRVQSEALFVAADGTITGGAQAFASWLRYRGGLYAIPGRALQLPVVRTVAAAVYRLIAANRDKMPGGTPACALPPPGVVPHQQG